MTEQQAFKVYAHEKGIQESEIDMFDFEMWFWEYRILEEHENQLRKKHGLI